MSDINPNRMIPLHVADQAVEACNKEIAQLKNEVARLRAASFVTAVPVEQYERLKHRAEGLREAGDELWFCLRHTKSLSHAEIQEAVEDWQVARDTK